MFTTLSDIDHKTGFQTICGVINFISPSIKRNKLSDITVELFDHTLEEPGFTVNLNLSSKILNQFLDQVKRGSLAVFKEIKIVKNDGVVYGEVWEEEEVQIFNDSLAHVKWYSEEKKVSITGSVEKNLIKLVTWKKVNFDDNKSTSSSENTDKKNYKSNVSQSRKYQLSKDNKLAHSLSSKASTSSSDMKRKVKAGDPVLPINKARYSESSVESTPVKSKKNVFKIRDLRPREKEGTMSRSSTESPKATNRNVKDKDTQLADEEVLNSVSKEGSFSPGSVRKSKRSYDKTAEVEQSGPYIESTPPPKLSKRSVSTTPKSTSLHMQQGITNPQEHRRKSSFYSKISPLKLSSSHKTKTSSNNSPVSNKAKELIQKAYKNINTKVAVNSTKNKSVKEKTGAYSDQQTRRDRIGSNVWTESVSNSIADSLSKRKNTFLNSSDSSISSDFEISNELFTHEDSLPFKRMRVGLRSLVNSDKTPKNISNISKRSLNLDDLNSDFPFRVRKPKKNLKQVVANKVTQKSSVTGGEHSSSDEEETNGSKVKLLKENTGTKFSKVMDMKNCYDRPKTLRKTQEKATKSDQSFESNEIYKKSDKDIQKDTLSREAERKNIPKRSDIDKSENSSSDEDDTNEGKVKHLKKNTETKTNKAKDMKNCYDRPKTLIKTQEHATKIDQSFESNDILNKSDKDIQKDTSSKEAEIKNSSKRSDLDESIKSRSSSRHKQAKLDLVSREDKEKHDEITRQKNQANTNDQLNEIEDKDSVFLYLQPLTRALSLKQVQTMGDVSLSDISEISVPEKFDLECKVISCFYLYDENIQVVRVQDGTVQKEKTLIIPESTSWEKVTQEIMKEPKLERNLPFIDIIIFDFSRLETPVAADNYYKFRNVMAVKFQLKNDPRKIKQKNVELFFCVRGQDAYNKKCTLSSNMGKEIETKIKKDPYKSVWETVKNTGHIYKKIDLSSKTQTNHGKLVSINACSTPVLKEIHLEDSVNTSTPSKRKTMDTSIELTKKTRKETSEKLPINIRTDEEISTNKVDQKSSLVKSGEISKFTNLSDEPLTGKVPSIVKEIEEIILEERVMESPQVESEDIHLKNSGSEVTFTQFCKVAEVKAKSFRTSTQREVCSGDLVFSEKQCSTSEESAKMEPLVYCPSNSSKSPDEFSNLKRDEILQDVPPLEQLSESVLKPRSNLVVECDEVGTKDKLNLTNSKENDNIDICNSSSSIELVNSHSSCSSEVQEIRILEKNNLENKETCNKNNKVGKKCKLNNKDSMSCTKQIIVGSDSSSNDSLSSILEKSIQIKRNYSHKKSTTLQTFLKNISGRGNQDEIQCSSERVKNIPDRCFFKSDPKRMQQFEEQLLLEQKEDSGVNVATYTLNKNRPVWTFRGLRQLMENNHFHLTVIITSTTPSISDSWAEELIKSRCPQCKQLYSVYKAYTGKQTKSSGSAIALAVGSHIVCPDSSCANAVLEDPECNFSLTFKLKNGSMQTAIVTNNQANSFFGCSVKEVLENEERYQQVDKVLKNIKGKMSNEIFVRIRLSRKDVFNPHSGPLWLEKIYM